MKDEQEVFVSRRGRRTTLDTIELGSMNIDEEQPVVTTAIETPKNPRFKPIREFHMPRPQMSRKKIAIISVSVLAIILLPLALLEAVAWQYQRAGVSLKDDIGRIAKQSALPLQKKTASADAMSKPLSELRDATNRSCRGGLLDNIAGIYPRSKSALDQCNAMKAKANAVVLQFANLQNIQRYSESADAILKPALAASDSPYAVLPDQVSAWQTVAEKLKKLNAPNELKTFHASLVQVSQDIAAQWSAINTANNAQDKAAFDEAETKLGSFYESLRDLSPTVIGVQQDVQSSLSSAVDDIL